MDDAGALTFKIATEPHEFEQIHRLNYKTFVEEIPQHPSNEQGVLVDRFHDQNIYAVCLRAGEVIGMMALRCQRPFSLDQKLGNIDSYLPRQRAKVVEIRLLATERDRRGGRVFAGLMAASARYLVRHGYDLAVISGTTRQLRLYRHMGFIAFGPLIGTPGAMYQPMYLTRDRFEQATEALELSLEKEEAPVSFLPGPVEVCESVRRAFAAPAVSHRSQRFLEDFRATQIALCALVNARHVQIFTGSGTHANDVVAAQLSLEPARGLILSNGEFGERLLDHAQRWGLAFQTVVAPWGEALDLREVERTLECDSSIRWLWAVHCETSTGLLNDFAQLKAICLRHDVKLCLDCISSIGTMPLDLSQVALASGASGKGLRSYAGLALVFHDCLTAASPRLPRALDLGYCAQNAGVPFTLCSNLLCALKAAVEQISLDDRLQETTQLKRRLCQGLEQLGLERVASEVETSPAVITLALAPAISTQRLGDALADKGIWVSYRSQYLQSRNWLQICLMGEYAPRVIERLLRCLGQLTTAFTEKCASVAS
jgi:aspartate aminotransferase-like enzyme